MTSRQPEFSTQNSLVPYSESDSDSFSEQAIDLQTCIPLESNMCEDETCVGKRGYKKQKPLPKRLQKGKQRSTSVQPNPCQNKKCGNLCSKKLSKSDRLVINEHFWGFGNKLRQQNWLLSCLTRKSVKIRRVNSNKKQFSYDYVINYNNANYKICQQFLLKTLQISQQMVKSVRNNAECLKTVSQKKNKHTPHNKSDEGKVTLLKNYIEQLPAFPSHYCRNKSTKLYLPQAFRNVKGLYKCYTEYLKNLERESAQLSLRVFRNIFIKDFNIGFHMPKKDKCVICENFKNLDSEAKNSFLQTEEYQQHIKDKDKSKEVFLEEQKQSKTNSSCLCVSFDLQKVLNTPHGKSVTLFYSRKYAYYNESFYENGTRNGYCFLWGETDGKRGCNEICTIVFQYLKLVDQKKTHSLINLFCDSCAGQNRNRAMLATLAFFLEKSIFINNIIITYLLPGHTMMPVDSIHSTIESFTRDRTVWAPSEWYSMISNSRTNPTGYECILMNNLDFKDWKAFSQTMFPTAVKISFPTLRSAHFEKNNPLMKLKYGYFENSEVKELDLYSIARSRRNSVIVSNGPLPLYNGLLKISYNKYKDLKTLCEKNTIPSKFHNVFLNLPNDEIVTDSLAETDQEDNIE